MRAERHARHPHAEAAGFPLPAGMSFGPERMKETMDAFQKACASAATIGAEWNVKMAETVRRNLTAGFELTRDLATARSLPDAIEISTAHARRQIDAALAQNRELWSLGQKLVSEAAQPMTFGLAKPLGPDASS